MAGSHCLSWAMLPAGFLAFLLCGCGGGPNLAKVSGTITYQGKPVTGALVTFYPEDKENIRGSMGETDEKGRYVLWTFNPGDGALVGSHKVAISKRGPPEKGTLHPSLKGKGKLGDAYYEQVTATGPPLIPEKYFFAETSGLNITVARGKHNTLDFPLEGEVKKGSP
ncbi:MAG: hypothetical protein EXR99_12895 [Gemmataceae bacterium]|nr:hypothetical protein [Gemmataceae bacterium]